MSASGGTGQTSRLYASPNIAGANVNAGTSQIFSGAFQRLLAEHALKASVVVPDGVAVSESWRSGANAASVKLTNYTAGMIPQLQVDYRLGAIAPSSGRSAGTGLLMGLRYARTFPGVLNVNPATTETMNFNCPGVVPTDAVFVSARTSPGTEMVIAQCACVVNDTVELKIGNAGTLQNDIDPTNFDFAVVRAGATGGTGIISELSRTGYVMPAVNVPISSSAVHALTLPGAQVGDVVIGSPDDTLGPDIQIANMRVSAADTVEVRFNNLDNAAAMNALSRTWNFAVLRQDTIR